MTQTIHRGIKDLLAEANAQIETILAPELIASQNDDGIVIVDLRDPREI